MKQIAIVILNWNGRALLEEFLPSVVAHSLEGIIYLADNASTDDSINFVKTHYPEVQIIKNNSNGGYAKGYNDALKQVPEPIYCLLNSDIEVTPQWLEPILDVFHSDQKTGIIQPKILDYKKKTHFEYAGAAGGFIDRYGYPYCRGRIFNVMEEDLGQYDDIEDIFWASGACLFIRKSLFETLQGFDDSFFAHMEEIDLCWRAHNLGYTVKYVGTSTVYHVGGATLNNNHPQKTYLNFRNNLYTITKNAPDKVVPILFTRMVLDGFAGVKFMSELKFKHLLAVLRAHGSFYSNLPKLIKERKIIKSQNPIQNPKSYYKVKSIVWRHFVKKKDRFEQ